MRELLVVNKVMETPLHNLSVLDFRWIEFSFRAKAHVLSCLWALFLNIVSPLLYFVIDIMVCPSSFMFLLDNCKK